MSERYPGSVSAISEVSEYVEGFLTKVAGFGDRRPLSPHHSQQFLPQQRYSVARGCTKVADTK